jgi:hypothetical protein
MGTVATAVGNTMGTGAAARSDRATNHNAAVFFVFGHQTAALGLESPIDWVDRAGELRAAVEAGAQPDYQDAEVDEARDGAAA